MATQKILSKSIFPDCPRDPQILDMKTGSINPVWQLFFQQLSQALQTNYKNEGVVLPPLSNDQILGLGDAEQAVGNIFYDKTNKLFKGIVLNTPLPLTTTTVTFTTT